MTLPTPPTIPAARPAPSALARYGMAVAAPLVALALTWIAPALQERATFLLFFAAVGMAAWHGLGPGLVATALSALLVDLAFVEPIGYLGPLHLDDVARLAGFAGVGSLIATLSERSRLARAEAEERRAEAETLARQLAAQTAQLAAQTTHLQEQKAELEHQSEEARALAENVEHSNEQIAQSERRVEAERARVTQVLDGLDAAVLALDPELRVLHVNRVAAGLLRDAGRDPDAALGRPLTDVVTELRGSPLLADLERAAARGEASEFDQHHPRLDRWRHVRLIPADGGVLIVARDVTDERRARARVAESESRYRALVEASSTMVWSTDAQGMVEDMPVWRELTGQTLAEVRGTGWTAALHPEDRVRVAGAWRNAHALNDPYEVEYRIRLAGGGYRWYQARAVPMLDEAGAVREWVGTFSDIHERRRAESALALLAGAGRLLESSLDVESTLHAVARLAVPGHADYCVVHVIDEDGGVSHTVAHVDAVGEAALRALADRDPADPAGESGWNATIRTGRAQHFPAVGAPADDYVRDSEHRRLLEAVGTRSAMVVPLTARDHVLGALTLGATDPDRRFDERDVAVAEQLGRRVALALDSARLFAAERAARREAEQASRTKSEFLATMSHELRTPLNAILGYTSLVFEGISGPVSGEQRRQLGRVQGSARHLLALIDEILTVSRLDAGRESLVLDHVDLCALTRDTAAMVEPSISVKGLRFVVDVPAAPVWAVTDATKVRQVLLNLLANASKFTEHGEVALVMRPRAEHAYFEVRDTGIGIGPEHLDRIFDAFWQVEQHSTRRAEGTGLGLHVARRLAQLLGGDVAASSRTGEGSIFACWIATNAQPQPWLEATDHAHQTS